MAATIKIKNSSTASAVPTSSDLVQGELAVNVTDKRLFTENASGTVVELGTNPTNLTVTNGATIQGLTVGRGAGAVSTNTAVGASALAGSNTGGNNTVFGSQAMLLNTSGSGATAIGRNSMQNNDTGTDDTAVGRNSLFSNTTGSNNVAVGKDALYLNTTASYNTAIGYQAGYSNTTGSYNTLVGYQAGYSISGSGNTLNTFIGQSAGYNITTGTKNTIIGTYNGNQGGLDIRTASNYIVLSDGDGNPRGWFNNSGNLVIGGDSTAARILPQTDNAGYVGQASHRWSAIYAVTGTIQTSDVNQKQDIASLDDAEKSVATRIKSLIKKFRFKDAVAEKGDAARIHVGVVAQEVAAAFVAEGLDPARYALFCSDTWTDETTNEEVTRLGIRYEELLAFVIAAL